MNSIRGNPMTGGMPCAALLMLSTMPTPIEAAGADGGSSPEHIAALAAMPTPKTSWGTVDLNGYWAAANPSVNLSANPGTPVTSDGRTTRPIAGAEIDEHKGNKSGVARRLANTALRPTYKPAYEAKAKSNWDRANFLDPSFGCQPKGVPRVGMPNEIVQTKNVIFFLYQTQNIYRVIHMDGRKPDPEAERMPMGESIGRWDGDTLVVEATRFPDADETWLDGDGSYHSKDMKVTERFTRKGNAMSYALTVEDPIFAAPFSPAARTMLLGTASEHVSEDYACIERDLEHIVTKERH